MAAVVVESAFSDEQRRRALYAGDTFFYTPRSTTKAFTNFAWELIVEAFHPIDPHKAQFELSVAAFVEILARLKPRFTHHEQAKVLLKNLLEDLGCDPSETYFDVPKLRVVTHGGYLTAGVGYAYKAHRDTWYACPPCQVNWWTPISTIEERNAFVIHPQFFQRAVPNNSDAFDAYEWNADGRKNAARYVTDDPRPHPRLQAPLELDRQVLVGAPGSVLLFSAQHLHATIPNESGSTRFSIDFRTVYGPDVHRRAGANLVDNASTGTTLRDFLRASDRQRFPEDVVSGYETGGQRRGVLVFDPGAT